MIVELGHFALWLGLALSVVQATVPLIGSRMGSARLMRVGEPAAISVLALIAISLWALIYAYVASDFSVINVIENSHSAKPLIYKISGTWGNHEGSMLLWIFILVLFGAFVALFGKNLPQTLRANVLAVQGMIGVAFMIFVVASSNPFLRAAIPPIEGQDLNPLLQDIGLAIHPPLLYLGYVGFSICFSFAVAALIDGKIDAAWARWVRPWTLTAWIFLTGGIAMGSYWAYYELGWGGFWFWDPVENASFLPWLSGTALLHSALVMEKRSALKVWTVLLALITFSLSLLGTFLVRSGVLTSVHSFATDPTRGIFILCILMIFIGGSFALYAFRAGSLTTGGLFQPISREGALVLNNLFLSTAAATVLIGTLYPLALETITGEKISVGPPFFNMTFGPLMLPLMVMVPFGTQLAWKRGDLWAATQRLTGAMLIALAAILTTLIFVDRTALLAALCIGLGTFVIVGSAVDLAQRAGVGKQKASVAWARFKGLPRSAFGTALAHAGLGVTLLGITGVTAFETEVTTALKINETTQVGEYTLTLRAVQPHQGPNYVEDRVIFDVSKNGAGKGGIMSAKRVYPARQMPTTEAGIRTFGVNQLYVSAGDPTQDGGVVVRAWYKPLVLLIWFGSIVMMIGGTLSLLDRRLRVGAPTRVKAKKSAEATA
ncbi:heme lyase CcmF/NrfE family subunit [Limoniibacter endophyticus]|uniref:C-type cytochrome biogenesis protein CcmF n=1 Tax=Limoniibacter endophyticus TaxID=1565040 RepID=A0A8J3GH30_9HYPH|nr:heme lyase CcmF/NrfE family subunit [Limoniibacter endophyticus]GHC69254.1 c-type cytochrome biogenesis protein CcmF [Limoniibacter endophyticus]